MDCDRKMIYLSVYENGVKKKPAGYAAVLLFNDRCHVQLYYRGDAKEDNCIQPVYLFRDGTVTEGISLPVNEGMAVTSFYTGRSDFVQSGRNFDELEMIYLDGIGEGICGGRPDGKELSLPDMILPMQTSVKPEILSEQVREEEEWSLEECLKNYPELKLPYDGIRRKCCRIELEDLKHLPKDWQYLRDNHFLLHGYYEYHHLLYARLACRYGERYAIGIPGEFCHRNQYMAENFGCCDFAPLDPGKRKNGCFGYWYYYLEKR